MTGGRGDIGQAIVSKFRQHHYEVIAPNSDCLNLNNLNHIEDYIQTLPAVDAFIHCAGINHPKPFQVEIFQNHVH